MLTNEELQKLDELTRKASQVRWHWGDVNVERRAGEYESRFIIYPDGDGFPILWMRPDSATVTLAANCDFIEAASPLVVRELLDMLHESISLLMHATHGGNITADDMKRISELCGAAGL